MVPPFADAFERLRAFGQVPVANIFSDLTQTEDSFAVPCFDRFAIYRPALLSDFVGRFGWWERRQDHP